jgi:hypothetical protein
MSQPHIFITKNHRVLKFALFSLSYGTVTLPHFIAREYSGIMNEKVKQHTSSAKGEKIGI